MTGFLVHFAIGCFVAACFMWADWTHDDPDDPMGIITDERRKQMPPMPGELARVVMAISLAFGFVASAMTWPWMLVHYARTKRKAAEIERARAKVAAGKRLVIIALHPLRNAPAETIQAEIDRLEVFLAVRHPKLQRYADGLTIDVPLNHDGEVMYVLSFVMGYAGALGYRIDVDSDGDETAHSDTINIGIDRPGGLPWPAGRDEWPPKKGDDDHA